VTHKQPTQENEMAHELRNANDMVYVGETPWHGLGVPLSQAPTTDELLACPQLNWQVVKDPIQNVRTGEVIEGEFSLNREDTGEHLATVSSSYVPVQNSTAIEFFRDIVDGGHASYETAGVLQGGKKMWVLAKMAQDPIEPIKGDPIMPYFLFSHGHDGESAVKITPTTIRVVCANTLGWADKQTQDYQVRIIHKSGVNQAIANVEKITAAAIKGLAETEEILRAMAGQPIDPESLENYFRKALRLPYRDPELLKADEEAFEQLMKVGARVMDDVRDSYEEEAFSLNPKHRGTLYHGFQAVTNYTTHKRGTTDKAQRLSQNWFGYGAQIRGRAMTEAIDLLVAA
jgi:phage/plasmid-like protein (TIGR03299 family)